MSQVAAIYKILWKSWEQIFIILINFEIQLQHALAILYITADCCDRVFRCFLFRLKNTNFILDPYIIVNYIVSLLMLGYFKINKSISLLQKCSNSISFMFLKKIYNRFYII